MSRWVEEFTVISPRQEAILIETHWSIPILSVLATGTKNAQKNFRNSALPLRKCATAKKIVPS